MTNRELDGSSITGSGVGDAARASEWHPFSDDDSGALAAASLAPEIEVSSPAASEEEVKRLLSELDLSDTHSVLHFGARAQERLTEISDRMLEGVRAKDVGAAGVSLAEMITTLKGLDVDGLDPSRGSGLLGRLLGRGRPIVRFLRQYEAVRDQIEAISRDLERHKTGLLTDVAALDRLYTANLEYFRALEGYIAAGEAKLRELDATSLPVLAAEVEASQDLLGAQRLRDLCTARDDLERRVHDLKLTRQVAMQALPSIRLVQQNDKSLIDKIGSTLLNTVPLWRQQLARAVTIYRSARAAETLSAATDLTNDLLRANAESLKNANAQARREVERGVFDIDAVEQANRTLIETIEESLTIADQGQRARAAASQQLGRLEAELRRALTAASARVRDENAGSDH
ncbi:toxic anion resistance protein [Thiorhodococcus minor]|uniref:Toxic anion resistance protein n=1 Tax=Thiorhodococcus minor TaxID=57489 RepID=A0A6M0JSG7_9GAMM|nr:toxic anion resistance protein [Thiorhodococcus minor]NEV60468.1 toxic anion resistance protein [Thiorhodococcus minor]